MLLNTECLGDEIFIKTILFGYFFKLLLIFFTYGSIFYLFEFIENVGWTFL